MARRAGVGKATVFRSYPAKDDLISAVASERVRWLAESAVAALDRDDAWAAFRELLLEIAERHASDLTQTAALARATGSRELDEARAAAREALGALMDRCKAEGSMRADASPADVHALFIGVGTTMSPQERHDVERWRRWAEIFAAALRA